MRYEYSEPNITPIVYFDTDHINGENFDPVSFLLLSHFPLKISPLEFIIQFYVQTVQNYCSPFNYCLPAIKSTFF